MYSQKERSGLYELTDAAHKELADSRYFNNDLAPVPLSERTWSTYHVSSLWICMSVCVPAFATSSSLVALGLSPWLAALNVFIGSLIVLVPIILNAYTGAKYGISFPIISRMTFGALGAHMPTLSRSIIACGWNALQSWIGGTALVAMISAFDPSFESYPYARIICFLVFLTVVCWITAGGSNYIRGLQVICAPLLMLLTLGLFIWSLYIARVGDAEGVTYSFIDIVRTTANIDLIESNGGFWFVFLGGLTGNIAFWSVMALNIPDFSRYAVGQRAQLRGQLYGMPLIMAVCALIGAFFARATSLVGITDANGNPIYDPTEMLPYLDNPFVIFIVSFGIIIATLTTNVAVNAVAPANGLSNIAPKRISYPIGAVISCVITIFFQPWNDIDEVGSSTFSWLTVFGNILAPMAAVFIADFYLVKKQNLDLKDLYMGSEGRYWYQNGWNTRAVFAWVCGWVSPILGVTYLSDNEIFTWISAADYLVAFIVGFGVYTLLMKSETSSRLGEEEFKQITIHDHL